MMFRSFIQQRRLLLDGILKGTACAVLFNHQEWEESKRYSLGEGDGLASIVNQIGLFPPITCNKTSMESIDRTSSRPLPRKGTTTAEGGVSFGAKKQKQHVYDFVVLGHGNAGSKAVETLRSQCPSATIAVVDPLQLPLQLSSKLRHYADPAMGFDPRSRTVKLSNNNDDASLQYRHALLVATGTRGAPPPLSLLDPHAWDFVLELRPTIAVAGQQHRPILPPQRTRQLAVMAASQGATVGILGSGWDALELAVATAKTRQPQQVSSTPSSSSTVLTFGAAGPLSYIVPRYLSTAVSKRLRQHGIQVQERSLVRYVTPATMSSGTKPCMEVHTAKSFDLLDTQRSFVNLMVVAPCVDGPRGTAIVPMLQIPDELESQNFGRTWFQTWSQLSAPAQRKHVIPSTVVCYADDGRISVNAELNAASKIYAAGSVAKFPNSLTGHAQVAGEGSVDGALAGQLAAAHMAREYHERRGGHFATSVLSSSSSSNSTKDPVSFASESFPVFRSDVTPYNPAEGNHSSLSKVGISALVVGTCDSDKMTTHGYWWTNSSNKKRSSDDSTSSLNTRRTTRANNNGKSKVPPIYGSGFVFYFDRGGHIRGVMSWGLPFTTAAPGNELNKRLLERMKDIIQTDGDCLLHGHDDPLLKSSHLEEESKRLVQLALESSRANSTTKIQRRLTLKDDIPKPLHRYTAAKPPSNAGLLKRSNISSSNLGEDLYIKDEEVCLRQQKDRPTSLVYVYPMHDPRHWREKDSTNKVDDPYLLTNAEAVAWTWSENERRARPPKEEPLWLRRDEIHRGTSLRDLMMDSFLVNMRQGRFADGSEAVQRPKVPESVVKAQAKLRKWVNGGNGDDDDDDYDDDTPSGTSDAIDEVEEKTASSRSNGD